MDTIEITKDNRIKGYLPKEISAVKFLRLLKKKINNCYIKENYDNDRDELPFLIEYSDSVSVYKYSDNIYKIVILNGARPQKREQSFLIDVTDNQYLIEQLDALCEITAKNDFEVESYKKIKNINSCSLKEKKAAINYLKYLKKNSNRLALLWLTGVISLGIIGSNFILSTVITFLHSSLMSIIGIPILFTATIGIIRLIVDLDLPSISQNKNVTNEIEQIELIETSEEITNNAKSNVYLDSVINHMHSIMFIADKLNDDDKKEVLFELRAILGEYTKRSLDFSKNQEHNLSLENERKIALDIISKLSDLELRIAIMMKDNNKEKSLIKDSEKLMKEINASLEVIGEEQTSQIGRALTR